MEGLDSCCSTKKPSQIEVCLTDKVLGDESYGLKYRWSNNMKNIEDGLESRIKPWIKCDRTGNISKFSQKKGNVFGGVAIGLSGQYCAVME